MKLSDDVVREIWNTRGTETGKAIAERLGVSPSMVSEIRSGKKRAITTTGNRNRGSAWGGPIGPERYVDAEHTLTRAELYAARGWDDEEAA